MESTERQQSVLGTALLSNYGFRQESASTYRRDMPRRPYPVHVYRDGYATANKYKYVELDQAMLTLVEIAHTQGPRDSEIWVDDGILLGSSRLSVRLGRGALEATLYVEFSYRATVAAFEARRHAKKANDDYYEDFTTYDLVDVMPLSPSIEVSWASTRGDSARTMAYAGALMELGSLAQAFEVVVAEMHHVALVKVLQEGLTRASDEEFVPKPKEAV